MSNWEPSRVRRGKAKSRRQVTCVVFLLLAVMSLYHLAVRDSAAGVEPAAGARTAAEEKLATEIDQVVQEEREIATLAQALAEESYRRNRLEVRP